MSANRTCTERDGGADWRVLRFDFSSSPSYLFLIPNPHLNPASRPREREFLTGVDPRNLARRLSPDRPAYAKRVRLFTRCDLPFVERHERVDHRQLTLRLV